LSHQKDRQNISEHFELINRNLRLPHPTCND